MMYKIICLCVFVFTAFSLHAEEGFVSLTTVKPGDSWTENGKALNGWVKHGGEATYEVRGDEIVGRRGPGPNTFLCTEKTYSNFILKFEFKYEIGCNSGMQFRCNLIGRGIVSGYQCEIDSGESTGLTGWIYDESRRNRWLENPTDEVKRRVAEATKPGQWNEMTIQCVGPSLKTWLNGVKIDDLLDVETQEGFFGLQVHGGPQGQLRWRNIRIKELPPTPWISLYGKGAFGEVTAEPKEKWTILDDGTLRASVDTSQTKDTLLSSKREYTNFAISFSFKKPGGPAGLFFRAVPNNQAIGYDGIQYELAAGASCGGLWETGERGWLARNDDASKKMYRQDDWNRGAVVVIGNRIATFLNGQKIVELNDTKTAASGITALQIQKGSVGEFLFDDYRIMPLDEETVGEK